jgi:cytochrome b561
LYLENDIKPNRLLLKCKQNRQRNEILKSVLSEDHRYSLAMIVVHWLMALGILTTFGVGLYMVDIPGITPFKLKLFNWHKWLGVTLFLLVLFRILIRMASQTPKYPAHWGRKMALIAKLGHWALYVLMLAVPIFGYLYSLAAGFPVVLFGLIELPVLIDKDLMLKDLFKTLHELSGKGLVFLVAGHVLMALKHQFLDNEDILSRIIPRHHSSLTKIALVIGVICFCFVFAVTAYAAPIDVVRSEVKATFKQFNVPVSGHFKRFSGNVHFNAASLADTKASLSVDTASYDLGDPEYNKEVAGKDWFNSTAYPRAVFEIKQVTGSGHELQATGDLTIRGIKKPLRFPVKVQTVAGMHTFTGKVPIKRLDYKVGSEGEWGDTTLVADEVFIDFKLVVPAK